MSEEVKEVVKEQVKNQIMKKFIGTWYAKISTILLPVLIFFVGLLLFAVIIGCVAAQKADTAVENVLRVKSMPEEALDAAYSLCEKDPDLDFIALVTYGAATSCGDWEKYKDGLISDAVSKLDPGQKIEDLLDEEEKPNYEMLYPLYQAIFADYIGVEEGGQGDGKHIIIKNNYPLPQDFDYTHCNDYGDDREYKGTSMHEGNDILAAKGTPICAIENGFIENIGWNEMGGYRIGIRSFDGKRYYYYAHMLKEHPYASGMEKGKTISAGDVIGFVGATGYSPVEGTTDLFPSHLHIQIEVKYNINGTDQAATIDPYGPLKFLEKYRKIKLIKQSEFEYVRDLSKDNPAGYSQSSVLIQGVGR